MEHHQLVTGRFIMLIIDGFTELNMVHAFHSYCGQNPAVGNSLIGNLETR